MRTNVLVYNGSGVSASSRDHCLTALRSFLGHAYDVQLVAPKALRQDPWADTCALLVFPGGRDLPYCYDLEGQANTRIRQWVEQGGRYLGFCAGAYYASRRVEFEVGTPLEVVGDRTLDFFPGVCAGTAFPGFAYETEEGAREVVLDLERSTWRDSWSQSPEAVDVWYNGGGMFKLDGSGTKSSDARVEVLARYAQLPSRPVAGVFTRPGGRGKAVLWAVHPERPTFSDLPSAADPTTRTYEEKEIRRRSLLRSTLLLLDLDVSEEPAQAPRILPMFLSSLDLTSLNNAAGAIAGKCTREGANIVLSDRNDSFSLHQPSSALALLQAARLRPGTSDSEEQRKLMKEICICTDGPPSTTLTPLFDASIFFAELQRATLPSGPRFGDVLLYGEAVTSTQTLLDKNDRFLSTVPTGLVCLASHQVAGRGRGGNSWVSPAGCLQFSVVLRLAASQSNKIVFLQYLFGLAVVESVKTLPGYEKIGLCIKWPNDIYADLGGEGPERYRKIGGILVNSSYANNEFTLVVGCGVNLSNAKPTTCINELIATHNQTHGTALESIRPEKLLALILAQLAASWDVFSRDGFAPFVDPYLAHWIHSDQRVTIAATGQVVKIVGITPEHGMLRTVAVDLDRNGREVFSGGFGQQQYIDLQPDGNSFDMAQGLLKAKSP